MNLKPCPFCGSPAELDMRRGFVAYDGQPGNAVAIYCVRCPADMSMCHRDHPDISVDDMASILAENWNARHEPALVR